MFPVLKQDKVHVTITQHNTRFSNTRTLENMDGVKVAALWVEDATSAYEETMKRGARSLWSLRLRKMNLESVLEFIPMEKQFIFLGDKIIKVFSCLDTKNGNQIIIQNQQV
jgi:hypothetical protein